MIKLNQLLKEETFTATNKQSGKTSVFKSKDSRDAAIKAGTHNPIKDKEQPSAPKAVGSDMFGGDYAKDRGGEAPKVEPNTTSQSKSDMGVDSVVYNKRTNTVGIVRMADERGETKTDADGNVNTDELEPYNPMKYPHQKDAQVAPSTQKEVDARGLWKPYSSNEGVIKLSKLMENDPCWKGYKQVGMKDKNGKEVPNCVPESVVNELGGIGKMQKLYLAVSEKVRTMQINQLAMFEKYKKETDPKKKAQLMDMLKKGTKDLEAARDNLSDIEEKYVMNLDADTEFDV